MVKSAAGKPTDPSNYSQLRPQTDGCGCTNEQDTTQTNKIRRRKTQNAHGTSTLAAAAGEEVGRIERRGTGPRDVQLLRGCRLSASSSNRSGVNQNRYKSVRKRSDHKRTGQTLSLHTLKFKGTLITPNLHTPKLNGEPHDACASPSAPQGCMHDPKHPSPRWRTSLFPSRA